MKSSINNFGALSKEYKVARRGYPDEVFKYLKSFVAKDIPITLDVGCGTGIATLQLKNHGFDVIGVDKDADMIRIAQQNDPSINYVVASADKLPFATNRFDIITAFTSLHWFDDPASMTEIGRVLKDGGFFFAALKENRSDARSSAFQKEYQQILKKYCGENYNSARDYHPKKLFSDSGFVEINEQSFDVDEHYSVEESLVLIRSLSFWNSVSESEKENMLNDLRAVFERYAVNGVVTRDRKISTIIGLKSNYA